MINMKKAQGLPISTVILVALGIIVLIILVAFVTGKLGGLGRTLSECQGTCLGAYTGDTPDPTVECDATLSKEATGTYILPGQQGVAIDKVKKCSKCCLALV